MVRLGSRLVSVDPITRGHAALVVGASAFYLGMKHCVESGYSYEGHIAEVLSRNSELRGKAK